MRSITLGRYLPGSSFLHRLNPRFKLLLLLIALAVIFVLKTYAGFSLLFLLLALAAAAVRLPLRLLAGMLRPIAYIVLITAIIYFFFTKGGVVLLRLGPLTVEQAGLSAGFLVIMRLLGLVFMSMLLTLTTTPLDLAQGVAYFLRPLGRLGLPAAELAMIMTIAMRFIPVVSEESQRLLRAQMARGADFGGGFFSRARKFAPLVVPLFIGAFRRADELALAMEARGYRIGARRTRLREEPVTAADWGALLLALAALAAVIYFRL
ncbi:MAG TPA: energy-coupling factor transporter transmembrane component T [Bacillota bacterium]|jgi:energy-coupling factor transport system permease protein|nr:energy-coupling factor transporter transmembrane component T [Bacillota bacterium]